MKRNNNIRIISLFYGRKQKRYIFKNKSTIIYQQKVNLMSAGKDNNTEKED